MHTNYDVNGELRAAHLTRELKAARHSVPEGGIGVFMRVALALIFMYLFVFSYTTLGIVGPVLVSVLALPGKSYKTGYATHQEMESRTVLSFFTYTGREYSRS